MPERQIGRGFAPNGKGAMRRSPMRWWDNRFVDHGALRACGCQVIRPLQVRAWDCLPDALAVHVTAMAPWSTMLRAGDLRRLLSVQMHRM
ncbi:hypothetical protein BTM36_17855 [Herbaspirillum sp. VT-16-41]|nr:hypothetical protein BTM36_17855 [Herbaspirillum sp. VT-16-41]